MFRTPPYRAIPPALCAMLADEGLRINSHSATGACHLSHRASATSGRVTMVSRTGWHNIGGRDVFVLPGRGHRPARRASMSFSTRRRSDPMRRAERSLNGGQDVAALCERPRACRFSRLAPALAGPLLYLAGQEGGGLNFYRAFVASGKTTVLQAGRERVGPRRVARLCAGMARDGERARRRGGERDRHGAYSRRIGRCRSARRGVGDLWACQWIRQGARGARRFIA